MIQKNTLNLEVIRTENSLICIGDQLEKIRVQLTDVKDTMRKLREKDVVFSQSTYCWAGGIGLKKKNKQIYPFLESQSKHLTNEKKNLEKEILQKMKILVQMLKKGQISSKNLDYRIINMLKDSELMYEDQLLGQNE